MILIKTIINKIDSDWVNIKNKCRVTTNKEYTDNIPNSNFKNKLLVSEHSPIRLLQVDWSWKSIKSWVSVHWVRHKWECFVSTRRTDRTGTDRNELKQSEFVNFDGVANAQNLIDTFRKRLCYQCSKETRELAEDFKIELKSKEPELSDVLVPNCIYRCGCPEFENCGFFNKFIKNKDVINIANINNRYELYNRDFYNKLEMK